MVFSFYLWFIFNLFLNKNKTGPFQNFLTPCGLSQHLILFTSTILLSLYLCDSSSIFFRFFKKKEKKSKLFVWNSQNRIHLLQFLKGLFLLFIFIFTSLCSFSFWVSNHCNDRQRTSKKVGYFLSVFGGFRYCGVGRTYRKVRSLYSFQLCLSLFYLIDVSEPCLRRTS